MPAVLAVGEVERLLGALERPKYRVFFATVYATGLRIREACQLETRDIDAARGVIHVRRSRRAGPLRSAGMSTCATPVASNALPTTLAATGIARSARLCGKRSGSLRAPSVFCRCATSTSSSPCRASCARSVGGIRARYSARSCRRRARRFSSSDSRACARGSASRWCCTRELRLHPYVHALVRATSWRATRLSFPGRSKWERSQFSRSQPSPQGVLGSEEASTLGHASTRDVEHPVLRKASSAPSRGEP